MSELSPLVFNATRLTPLTLAVPLLTTNWSALLLPRSNLSVPPCKFSAVPENEFAPGLTVNVPTVPVPPDVMSSVAPLFTVTPAPAAPEFAPTLLP